MVEVAPFDGLLYDPAVAGAPLVSLTSPPYDTVLPHERDRLHAASPFNIARVDLGGDQAGDPATQYTRAGERLRAWEAEGVLVRAGQPALYPYEMRFGYRGEERRVRGLVAEVAVEPWGGSILPHERTMAAPVEDRLRLLRATAVDLSPIYLVAPGPCQAQAALLDRASARPPDLALEDDEGVEHRLWVEEPEEEVLAWYRGQHALIADGHHRYQTALAHRGERRGSAGHGPWDAVMALLVDAATEDPPVLPIHRLVRVHPLPDLPGHRVHGLEEVLARLGEADLLYGAAWREAGGMVHLVGGLEGPPPAVSALHREVLDPLPGVAGLRFVPDAALAEAEVRGNRADLAIFLPPARVEHVRGVVEAGGRLPEKSTYFWPKPRTGMVMRPLA